MSKVRVTPNNDVLAGTGRATERLMETLSNSIVLPVGAVPGVTGLEEGRARNLLTDLVREGFLEQLPVKGGDDLIRLSPKKK